MKYLGNFGDFIRFHLRFPLHKYGSEPFMFTIYTCYWTISMTGLKIGLQGKVS